MDDDISMNGTGRGDASARGGGAGGNRGGFAGRGRGRVLRGSVRGRGAHRYMLQLAHT